MHINILEYVYIIYKGILLLIYYELFYNLLYFQLYHKGIINIVIYIFLL
jgi:hypothetical protein